MDLEGWNRGLTNKQVDSEGWNGGLTNKQVDLELKLDDFFLKNGALKHEILGFHLQDSWVMS